MTPTKESRFFYGVSDLPPAASLAVGKAFLHECSRPSTIIPGRLGVTGGGDGRL